MKYQLMLRMCQISKKDKIPSHNQNPQQQQDEFLMDCEELWNEQDDDRDCDKSISYFSIFPKRDQEDEKEELTFIFDHLLFVPPLLLHSVSSSILCSKFLKLLWFHLIFMEEASHIDLTTSKEEKEEVNNNNLLS